MPRQMSAGMLDALQSAYLLPAVFVAIEFADGPIYVWSGSGPITWGGKTWAGVGTLGSISVIDEGTSVEAKGVTLALSGIDNSMLAEALQELQLGLPVTIYLGLFSLSPPGLIDDPLLSWAGRVDQPTIEVGGDAATISINCESELLDMNVAVDRRYTHDDQTIDHPGDLGFQFVNSIQEATVYWGRTPVSGNNL